MDLFDVAIVGMGPVGAAGAVLFADAGLKVVVFERDKEVHPLPRAVGMDGEVLRAFQTNGRGEDLAAILQPIRPGDRAGFANSNREWLFGSDLPSYGPPGWPPLSMFDQPEVDSYLRETAVNHPNVTSYIGYEACGLSNEADKATITARDTETGEEVTCAARYIVGCDGANSYVRKSMDVNWRDLGYNQDWLVIDVIAGPDATLPTDILQVCDPKRITTYVATKDPTRRWEFRLNEGETREEMLKEENIFELLDPWTPRGTYEIRRAAVYQFHAIVADKWRDNRIFLAGDAAHQTPPFLGQGMNAGMRDVANLAWKLPRAINGSSPDSLLDSYYDERIAHSEDLIEWAVAIGRLMEHLAAAEAFVSGDGPEPTDAPQLSAGYGQGRAVPPLRHGVLMEGQVSDVGSTGYQLEQPDLCDAAGKVAKLDDLLGKGFAIIGKTSSDLSLSPTSQAIVQALGIQSLSLEGYKVDRGRLDPVFKKANAVILRPDRYLFGHTTETDTLDTMLAELEKKLGTDEVTQKMRSIQ